MCGKENNKFHTQKIICVVYYHYIRQFSMELSEIKRQTDMSPPAGRLLQVTDKAYPSSVI